MRTAIAALVLLVSAAAWADEPRVIEVTMDSFRFEPDRITVAAGETVTLRVTNVASFLPHNLIIRAPEAGLDVVIDLGAGRTGEVTFTATKPGTYPMICDKKPPFGKSHADRGMTGVLVVE